MKIIIIGLPKSGRTTVAKALSHQPSSHCISGFEWIKGTFRNQGAIETNEDYEKELHLFVKDRLKIKPYLFVDNIYDVMDASHIEKYEKFIIDGLNSPRDFINLFDYNNDVIIFLNRTDTPDFIESYDQLAINVIRDYCLWLGTMDLLPKERWLEFNFSIPGDSQSDFSKKLGQKNTVIITKSIDKTIAMIKDLLWNQI